MEGWPPPKDAHFFMENMECWIFRANLFFVINHLFEAKRMMAAGVSFEEEALAWF